MREIDGSLISEAVAKMAVESCCYLGDDVFNSLKENAVKEPSPTGKAVLEQLVENAEIAAKEELPICQDCGLAVVFAEIGQDVHINGDFETAINEGMVKGYADGFLRKSTCAPLTRSNFGNNKPAVIHSKLVPGDKIKLTIAPKGGGSENMSALKMMTPAAGREGIVDFVVNTVREAGPNPCPPIVVGVGVGVNFEGVALLAKEALLREIGSVNEDETAAGLEKELLEKINTLGIGPGGLGGRTTALAVHVKMAPCHIASLPVAVNINCHASRHKTVIL